MRTLELTQDACDMICKCIAYKIESILNENTYLEDVPDEYDRNLIEICKLQTLMNYIES